MKKCSRYLDSLDGNAAVDSAWWQDVLVHAGKCPDCSTDMKFRAEMLEKLSEVCEPEYPADLHDTIMSAISARPGNNSESEENGFFSRLIEQFLQPLEIVVSLACVLMFVFLMQLNNSPDTTKSTVNTARHLLNSKPETFVNRLEPDEESLEHVSSNEVKEFLAKYEEFRRIHPDKPAPVVRFIPGVELVDDKQLWREP